MTTVLDLPITLQPELIFRGFEEEAYMERHSHSLRKISIYAPVGPVSQHALLPWLLTTEQGWEGHESAGLRYIIKADKIIDSIKHIAIIGPEHFYAGPLDVTGI